MAETQPTNTKCDKYMIIRGRCHTKIFTSIEEVTFMKYLGVQICDRLTFIQYLDFTTIFDLI
jgi:hypothetical protein